MTPEELTAARTLLELSQSELADALKLSVNGARLVRRWEQGDIPISGPAAAAVELLLILRRTAYLDSWERRTVGVSPPTLAVVEFVKALARATEARDYREALSKRVSGDCK